MNTENMHNLNLLAQKMLFVYSKLYDRNFMQLTEKSHTLCWNTLQQINLHGLAAILRILPKPLNIGLN